MLPCWARRPTRVYTGNTTNCLSRVRLEFQPAHRRGRDHPALLLLRCRGGHYPAFVRPSGPLSRSGRGVPGTPAHAANDWFSGDGSTTDHGDFLGGLRPVDAHLGFCRGLARVPGHPAGGYGYSAGEAARPRGKRDRTYNAGRHTETRAAEYQQQRRAQLTAPRHWFIVCPRPGGHIRSVPGFLHAGGETRGVAQYLATLSGGPAHTSEGDAGGFARCVARLSRGHD